MIELMGLLFGLGLPVFFLVIRGLTMIPMCLSIQALNAVALMIVIQGTAFSDEPIQQQHTNNAHAQLKETAKRLTQSKAKAAESTDLGDRIRESTWRLLVGEAAANPDLKMFSAAVDSFTDGLAQLDQIDQEVEASEELQRKLAESPQLAMRMDLAINGREATAKNRELARDQELLRLQQLREINREYRALIEDLLASQTEILFGNSNELHTRLKSAGEHLKQVESVVAKRDDYYLFSDEPNVEAADSELEIVASLAKPYSTSTQLHQRLVAAHALLRESLISNPGDPDGLRGCLEQLDQIAPEEVSENSLFHNLRGVASMELGLTIVGDRVWDTEAHKEAAQYFADAKKSLETAVSKIADTPAAKAQLTDMSTRLSLLSDEQGILSQVQDAAVKQHSGAGSLELLEKGVRAHGSARLYLAWVYSRWQKGVLNASEALNLLNQAKSSSLLDANDQQVILTSARIAVIDAWNRFQVAGEASFSDDFAVATADLQALRDAADVETQLEASSLAALLNVMISADGGISGEAAKATFQTVGITATELETRWNLAEGAAKYRLANAAVIARLSEGYLAVKFESTDSNRAQLAFAAAAAIATKSAPVPFQPYPNAIVLLKTMLTREDAANLRLAMSERSLRMALQKSLPSVITSSFNSSPENTVSLVRDAQDLITSGSTALQPSSQLDPTELAGAAASVRYDASSVAAFSLLSSKQPTEAIRLLLAASGYKVAPGDDVSRVRWNDAISLIETNTNPLLRNAFAESLEYYAADTLAGGDALKPALLQKALAMQQRVSTMLEKESLWAGKWPFLKKRVNDSILRLTDASMFLTNASELRGRLELSDARQLLRDGTARFPENPELRMEFAQTLLDESETNSGERERLLKEAVATLDGLPQSGLSSKTLLKAAELHEKLGDKQAAILAYQAVLAANPSKEGSLIARSRISSLRLSVAAK